MAKTASSLARMSQGDILGAMADLEATATLVDAA
jgi:hypothetical protein